MTSSVFSSQLYSSLLSTLSVASVFVAAFIMGLSLSHRTAELAAYRYFIFNFALFDLLSALACFFSKLKIVPTKGLMMGQSSHLHLKCLQEQ